MPDQNRASIKMGGKVHRAVEPNAINGPPRIALDTNVLDDHAGLDKYLVQLANQSLITKSTEESLY